MEEISKIFNVTNEEIAHIGDDLNDLEIIEKSGFSACPNDAFHEVKERVDYVCEKDGGKGVFREFAEVIMKGLSNG